MDRHLPQNHLKMKRDFGYSVDGVIYRLDGAIFFNRLCSNRKSMS